MKQDFRSSPPKRRCSAPRLVVELDKDGRAHGEIQYRQEIDPIEAARAARTPATEVWKQRRPSWVNSQAFQKERESLETLVNEILSCAPARRAKELPPRPGYVPAKCSRCGKILPRQPVRGERNRGSKTLSLQEKLAEHSYCVTDLLLETRWVHDANQRQDGLHKIAIGPPLRVRGEWKCLTFPGPALLRSNVRAAREARDEAQGRYRALEKRAKRGGVIPLQEDAQARWDLTAAQLTLQRAKDELHSFRSGLPGPAPKQDGKFEHGAILGILHELHSDYGVPDVTISKLLTAAGLPFLAARNIKRIRSTFRRP